MAEAPIVQQQLEEPNCTVYIRNLNEKIKIPALKKSLEEIFSKYGTVLEIIAHKNIWMRGQAFIVFDRLESASVAIKNVQGYPLQDKPMILNFARQASEASLKRKYGEESEEFKSHQAQRKADKEIKQAARPQHESSEKKKKLWPSQQQPSQPTNKIADEYLPPNNLLFVTSLPDSATQEVLTAIFGRFTGFVEVRMVPGREGIAFVEYDDLAQAALAKEHTGGMTLEGRPIQITYARQ